VTDKRINTWKKSSIWSEPHEACCTMQQHRCHFYATTIVHQRRTNFFPKIQETAQNSRRQKGYTKLDQYYRRFTDIGRRSKIFSRHGDLSYGILYRSQNIFRAMRSGLPKQKGGTKVAGERHEMITITLLEKPKQVKVNWYS